MSATGRERLRRCRSSTYDQARPWARSIKQRVLTHQMPPWHIDKSVGIQQFSNDRSLSDEQIATIVRWVDTGAPHGRLRRTCRRRSNGRRRRLAAAQRSVRPAGSDHQVGAVHHAAP